MKFPYSMLLDFVRTPKNAEEIGDLLTMAGFELEGIEEVEGDSVLDIKVMSNRGDGLSVFGLAREVLAKDAAAEPTELYESAAKGFPDSRSNPRQFKGPAPVVALETTDCTRYAAQSFESVSNGSSPEWIQKRLRQVGMRTISRFVDLTNYVMLELGQPLHAFDQDKLEGGRIVVRLARPGEKLTTLDSKEHELNARQMVICDAQKPVAAAGIMGGLDSEIGAGTKRILLESAHFNNLSVRRTRKELGLSTDASYRFERSVDPEGVVRAVHRFDQLLGEIGSEIVDVYPHPVEPQAVELSIDRASRLLGMDVHDADAHRYLSCLGMTLSGHGNPYYVLPPTWRPDLKLEEDLIEEIGRVQGYEQIPSILPSGITTLGGARGGLRQEDRLRESAIRAGFIQIISHSLRDRHPLDAAVEPVMPRVAPSPEMAYLRSSLWPSLAEAAQRNGGRNLRLLEIGKVFHRQNGQTLERKEAALLQTGDLVSVSRKGEAVPQADFFSMKGALESIFADSAIEAQILPEICPDERLHPHRQAKLVCGETTVGRMGQIHPSIAEKLRLPELTFLAAFDLDLLFSLGATEPQPRAISRNPAVGRDISLLIDKSIPYRQIEEAISDAAGEVLEKQWLFDVFEGANIPAGKHSLGIGLQLRKLGENFTDEQANQVRERVVAALERLGGTTR